MELSGKTAVVTGAASGIGRALCIQLAEKGMRVALVDVNAEGLEETAGRLRAVGADCETFVADVADRERMRALPAEVEARFGDVHLLVNNAGVSVGATFAEQTLEDLDWIININLWGVIHGCKFFLPILARQEQAHIVNLSSMFGFFGLAGQASYCMTKAGVKALSEALWTELADTGIGVPSVHPGGIATEIIRSARIVDPDGKKKAVDAIARYGHSPEKAAAKIVRAVERERKRVIIGPEAYAADWMKRLLPVSMHRLLTFAHLRSDSTKRARIRTGEQSNEENS